LVRPLAPNRERSHQRPVVTGCKKYSTITLCGAGNRNKLISCGRGPSSCRTGDYTAPEVQRSSPVYPGPAPGVPRQIRALPAGITNRVGRFRRTPAAANTYFVAGDYTFTSHGPDTLDYGGLDLSASMFAPCSLGCPGTPREHPVSAARRGYRQPHRMTGPGRFWHLSIPLLICGHIGPVAGGFPSATN